MTTKLSKIAWDVAGLTDLNSTLGRPIDTGVIPVPGVVSLSGDRLVWRGVAPGWERDVASDKRMLDGFIKLADASNEAIRDFASRWGVLHICEHGLPASHIPESYEFSPAQSVERCTPLGWPAIPEDIEVPENEEEMEPLFSGWDPIEKWKSYSREAQAILNIAASLYLNNRGRREDWKQLTDDADELLSKEELDTQFRVLMRVVEGWLVLGNVRPWLTFHRVGGRKGQLRLSSRIALGGYGPEWGHLFGALACQLLFTVTRNEGLAFCSNCGDSYVPTRKPRTDQKNYCRRDECRKKAAWRHAAAKKRGKEQRRKYSG